MDPHQLYLIKATRRRHFRSHKPVAITVENVNRDLPKKHKKSTHKKHSSKDIMKEIKRRSKSPKKYPLAAQLVKLMEYKKGTSSTL